MALNFGSAYQNSSGNRATAAQWDGGLVQTTSDPPALMSLMVEPNPACLAAPFPTSEPANSCSTSDHTLLLPGNANLFLAGIQYAPTDNTEVRGNGSGSTGVVGQIISWTIEFKGGASLNLQALISDTVGTLRLDPACSPTVNVCNP